MTYIVLQLLLLKTLRSDANGAKLAPLGVFQKLIIYMVQYAEGAKVDWIVLMCTLKWQGKVYMMLKMEKNLITYIIISFQFSNIHKTLLL